MFASGKGPLSMFIVLYNVIPRFIAKLIYNYNN